MLLFVYRYMKKTEDPALPYFTRFYKKHKKMIREIAKARKIGEAKALRLLVEEGHAKYVVKV